MGPPTTSEGSSIRPVVSQSDRRPSQRQRLRWMVIRIIGRTIRNRCWLDGGWYLFRSNCHIQDDGFDGTVHQGKMPPLGKVVGKRSTMLEGSTNL